MSTRLMVWPNFAARKFTFEKLFESLLALLILDRCPSFGSVAGLCVAEDLHHYDGLL